MRVRDLIYLLQTRAKDDQYIHFSGIVPKRKELQKDKITGVYEVFCCAEGMDFESVYSISTREDGEEDDLCVISMPTEFMKRTISCYEKEDVKEVKEVKKATSKGNKLKDVSSK